LDTSILSFPERSRDGDSRYRGNCAGQVIEELVQQYIGSEGVFVDACAGSGTSRDVLNRAFPGVTGVFLDLNGRFGDRFDFTSMSIKDAVVKQAGRKADLSFTHPPYGPMIKYSGSVWGSEVDSADTSQCSEEEFLERSRFMLHNLRDATRPGGHYTTLIGDRRCKGRYSSYQADFIGFMPKAELRAVLIKAQHNCVSDTRSYKLRHPRIMHEYLLVWERTAQRFVSVCWEKACEQARTISGTWALVIRFCLMKLGGKASLDLIYREVEKVAGDKKANNPTWRATVRRTLQQHFNNVERGVWTI